MKRNPEETKQKILRAGVQEFAEKGMAGARVDEIAQTANINKAMIYHYFGNKEQFYEMIILTQMEQLYTTIEMPKTETIVETIKSTISAYFDYCMQHPEYVSLMTWEMVNQWQTLNELSSEIDNSFQTLFIELVEKGKSVGIVYSSLDSRFFLSIGVLQVFCSFSLFQHPNLLKAEEGALPSSKEKENYKQQLITSILRSVIKEKYLSEDQL